MNQIYNTRGNDFINSVEMAGYLYMLLAIYMREAENKNKLSRKESYVIKTIEYISSNYVGLSRSYLCRAFQAVLNKSPKEYLSEYRIKQACYLLTHNEMSMIDIAESVGFENSLYFSKVFHKQMGMPPTEYARQHKTPD